MVMSPSCSGPVIINMTDASGRIVYSEKADVLHGQNKTLTLGRDLPAGIYTLYFEYDGKSVRRSVIKMNRTEKKPGAKASGFFYRECSHMKGRLHRGLVLYFLLLSYDFFSK
jgi:hypothetical protein